jgi:hypothetical protein
MLGETVDNPVDMLQFKQNNRVLLQVSLHSSGLQGYSGLVRLAISTGTSHVTFLSGRHLLGADSILLPV